MERTIEMEIQYFIKKKNRNVRTLSKTALLTQKFGRNFKTRIAQKQENSTPQISTESDVLSPRNVQYWASQIFTEASPIQSR
jgi:hypothetical protein